jgi:hypothetical protein
MIKSIYEQPCINRALTRVLSSESKKEKKRKAQGKYASLADDGHKSCNTTLHSNASC